MKDRNDTIGDVQFLAMCNMWGLDLTLETIRHMGMTASDSQIELGRKIENETKERFNKASELLVNSETEEN